MDTYKYYVEYGQLVILVYFLPSAVLDKLKCTLAMTRGCDVSLGELGAAIIRESGQYELQCSAPKPNKPDSCTPDGKFIYF